MQTLSHKGLNIALARLSRVESLLASDRVCLATSQGRLPDLRGRDGFIVHGVGSVLPWFLRPFGLVAAAGHGIVEITQADGVVAFAEEADGCFTVKFYSFSRSTLPSVLSYLRSRGWGSDPEDVAHEDPTYCELEFNCDGVAHDDWLILSRCNRDCPADLAACLAEIDRCDFDGGGIT